MLYHFTRSVGQVPTPRSDPSMAQTTAPSTGRADIDRVAVALSALCLLHCLALPLVIAMMPFVAE
ncbi:MAG: MerC family mercury resistance protein, partial [Halioglobus sp.]|nr:MerC family mercury resistance protein [Halioglobus sp.]